jgi:ubiquinone/menaquinone biosynthesis C-methylase UbiE
MPVVDVYGRTQELDRPSLDAIATRLEARRGSERYMRILHEYLDALDWRGVRDILALGCGTGVEVRELLRRPSFAGRITALDISPVLIAKAQKFTQGESIPDPVDWRVGDAQALDLPDASFDLVLAHTLVSHVPDPERVVREIARVVRPGGTAVILDGDYATMTYGTDDAEAGRRMDEKIIASVIAQPRVMRAMPRMLRRAGLELVDSRGWVLTEIGRADFFLGSLESFRVLLPKAGVATSEEAEAFVADQLRSSDEGTFFAGANFYAMIARRPG